jgi:hypothetical protein
MSRSPKRTIGAALLTGVLLIAGCGSDEQSSTSSGGSDTTSASGGDPKFLTFDLTSTSEPCDSENATFTMSYSTENVDSMSIDIGGSGFAETAGYGPNESSVVAAVPCSGAGSSSIQMKGCNVSGACAESEKISVTITG